MTLADALSPLQDRTEEAALKSEYAEAGLYLRHYSSLRFAMLTVYFAVVGTLAAVTFGAVTLHVRPSLLPLLSRVPPAAAFFITAVFFTFELTCEAYLEHFAERLRRIESTLGFRTMIERPRDRSGVKLASRSLYAVNLVFWAVVTLLGV